MTLRRRQDRAAENGHDQKRGRLAFVNAGALDREREGVRPTDGGKKADPDDAPHRELAAGDDGGGEERADREGKNHESAAGQSFSALEQKPAKQKRGQIHSRRGPPTDRDEDCAADEGNGSEQELFRPRRQIAEFDRAHETADQHAKPEKGNITAGLQLSQTGDLRLAKKVDDGTADGDFAADIHEDREHPESDVRKLQRGKTRLDFSFTDIRQANEEKQRGEQNEDGEESQVRHFHGVRAVRAGADKILKDQIAADQRTESGAERVKSLGEIQPARGSPFRPENCDVRISRDLEHGETETDDEERRQEKRVGKKSRRRPEKAAARRGDDQADHDTVLVAQPRDGIAEAGGDSEVNKRTDKVGAEERELDEHGVEVIEGESILEARDEDVVEDRHESPHEEEDGHDRERTAIGLPRGGGDCRRVGHHVRRRGCASVLKTTWSKSSVSRGAKRR